MNNAAPAAAVANATRRADATIAVVPLVLPVALLLAQIALLASPPTSRATAYASMALAPLLAGLACAARARAEAAPARGAWSALAGSMLLMAVGAGFNLWHEWIGGERLALYRDAAIAFNLATVPLAFLLAGDWSAAPRRLARAVDAALAGALGAAFFVVTWSLLTSPSVADGDRVRTMVAMLDAQNAFLALGAALRWGAAEGRRERDLFGSLALFLGAYAAVVAVNNRVFALDAATGAQWGSIVSVAFALLGGAALRGPWRQALHEPPRLFARAVRAASPLLVAGALLIVSLFLVRVEYAIGAAGVVIAVAGLVVRSASSQVRQLEAGEDLQREHSELLSIAWTDALTGISNRRFLEQMLERASRREMPLGQQMAIAMIDVDHFKALNDRLGHAAGDDCLRDVAAALAHSLARPGDVLSRYGGEEFVVLLHDADLEGAKVVGERLRAAVEALGVGHPTSPHGVVTVSVGVASGRPGPGSAVRLLAGADRALYAAKQAGRNRVAARHPLGPGTAAPLAER